MKFPYLVQKKLKPGQEVRRVAQLEWKIIENDSAKSFEASGLQFVPLPVSFVVFISSASYHALCILFYLYIFFTRFLYIALFLFFLGDAW